MTCIHPSFIPGRWLISGHVNVCYLLPRYIHGHGNSGAAAEAAAVLLFTYTLILSQAGITGHSKAPLGHVSAKANHNHWWGDNYNVMTHGRLNAFNTSQGAARLGGFAISSPVCAVCVQSVVC